MGGERKVADLNDSVIIRLITKQRTEITISL